MEAILETKAETILQFIGGLRGSLYVAFEEGTGLPGCTICSNLTSPACWPAIRAIAAHNSVHWSHYFMESLRS